ncbi:hypothetical protein SAMN05519103_01765 [Rhizobiales bacterium GAS113]|nr:hypothetical protein SAMN05519103_01765 [Rhizobiales bacterium GAS113]
MVAIGRIRRLLSRDVAAVVVAVATLTATVVWALANGHLDNLPPYLLALGAIGCLISAVLNAWRNRNASAVVLGALFLVCVILAYFPQLDSIQAFSVRVRTRQTLNRADEILAQVKELALLSAKTTYNNMSWANRIGGMPLEEKQGISDQIDAQLKSYGISNTDIKHAKTEYVALIGYDLGAIFEIVLSQYVSSTIGVKNPSGLLKWSSEWNANGRVSLDKISGIEGLALSKLLKSEIPVQYVDADDADKFGRFADKIGVIYSSCLVKLGYTTEAISFFNEYRDLSDDLLKRALK